MEAGNAYDKDCLPDDVIMGIVDPLEERKKEEDNENYTKARRLFFEHDLDWNDISENIDECTHDEERIGVVLRWMDSQCIDDDWKEYLPSAVINKHISGD